MIQRVTSAFGTGGLKSTSWKSIKNVLVRLGGTVDRVSKGHNAEVFKMPDGGSIATCSSALDRAQVHKKALKRIIDELADYGIEPQVFLTLLADEGEANWYTVPEYLDDYLTELRTTGVKGLIRHHRARPLESDDLDVEEIEKGEPDMAEPEDVSDEPTLENYPHSLRQSMLNLTGIKPDEAEKLYQRYSWQIRNRTGELNEELRRLGALATVKVNNRNILHVNDDGVVYLQLFLHERHPEAFEEVLEPVELPPNPVQKAVQGPTPVAPNRPQPASKEETLPTPQVNTIGQALLKLSKIHGADLVFRSDSGLMVDLERTVIAIAREAAGD